MSGERSGDGPESGGQPEGATPSTGTDVRPVVPPPFPSWMRRPRALLVFGAVALVLLLGATWLSATGDQRPDFDDSLTGPVAEARVDDELEDGPVVTGVHPDCGLSQETVERLAPDGDRGGIEHDMSGGDHRECSWESGGLARSMGGSSRELTVDVRAHGAGEYGAHPVGSAVRGLRDTLVTATGDTTGQTEITEITPFTGFGDEAVLLNAEDASGVIRPDEELAEEDVTYRSARTTILVRVGNTVVDVSYSGADYEREDDASLLDDPGEELLDPDTTWGGAVLAAEEVVDSLGGEVDTPFQAVAEDDEPLAEVPDACADLPEELRTDLAVDGDPEGRDGRVIEERRMPELDVWEGGCDWSGGRRLSVDMGVLSDERIGGGTAAADREYLFWYLNDRTPPEPEDNGGGEDAEPPPDHLFVPLAGVGDAAFTAFEGDEDSWKVDAVFRDRNLVVRVTLRESYVRGPMPTADEALNDTHRLLEEIAGQVADLP
ncbi:hypothetical protein [Nocardiopsis oceani]